MTAASLDAARRQLRSFCRAITIFLANARRRGPGGAQAGAPGHLNSLGKLLVVSCWLLVAGAAGGCQTSSVSVRPDGTLVWERSALLTRLELGEASVRSGAYSASLKGLTSDTAAAAIAAGELARAAAAIAAKLPAGGVK